MPKHPTFLPGRRRRALLATLVTASAAAAAVLPSPAAADFLPAGTSDPVLAWYDATTQAIGQTGWANAGNTQIAASRAWAISWGAADQAIAALPPTLKGRARAAATTTALVTALYDTLSSLVPQTTGDLRTLRRKTLSAVPGNPAKLVGRAAGDKAAAEQLTARDKDGLYLPLVNAPFTPPASGIGVFSNPGAVQAGQGNAKPFLVPDVANRFLAAPPPALDSPTEIADLQEVDAYGSKTSKARSIDQTSIATFWSQTSVNGFVAILREVIKGVSKPIAPRVHLISVFHRATIDEQIAIYHAKYVYLRWRPITALTVDDENPATPLDPSFVPLLNTPNHPEYPSGHTGYAGAAQAVLTALVGPKPLAPITVTSTASPNYYRTYTQWSQITQDNIDARVWEGVHLRSTDVYSAGLGGQIAAAALRNAAVRR
ncbi:MAG: phosphoesterase PA-phosphatase [Solirubrobacterales bacterium]|nr:phosphoesterase PA-phosphatase [Solirubrobacterales bacterium]